MNGFWSILRLPNCWRYVIAVYLASIKTYTTRWTARMSAISWKILKTNGWTFNVAHLRERV